MTDSHSDSDQLLAIGDVAKTFSVTVATVRNWDRLGQLVAVRTPSGHRRFRRVDVEKLLSTETSA